MKHTHTHKRKFTAQQIAEWNKRQLEINFEKYEKDNVQRQVRLDPSGA